jgi:predicted N-acetyltransferase YhbS
MTIREMGGGDVEAVTRLMRQMYPGEDGSIDPGRIRLEWKAFVATDEHAATIGFLLGTILDYGMAAEHHGTIAELSVDESTRRRGVGRDLVEGWKAWLREEGVPIGFLLSAEDAIPFYEACGFEPSSSWMVWSAGRSPERLPRP